MTVKREILFLKRDYWIIRDTIAAVREHRIDISFHFDSAPGAEQAVEVLCFGHASKVKEEAFVSHCYGQKEAAKALRFSANLNGNGEIVTFLLPQQSGTQWDVTEIETNEGREFEVRAGNTRDTVIIPASGPWLWTRTSAGEVSESLCAALTE